MKQLYATVLIVLLTLIVSTQTVSADFGPKPTLLITIVGVSEEYQLDVLVEVDEDIDRFELDEWNTDSYYHHEGFPDELIEFRDRDGYGSYTLYSGPGRINNPSDGMYEINYYAPRDFKIVLVMENDRSMIISDIVQTTHFESRVVWNLEDTDLSHSSFGEGELSGTIEGDPLNSGTWYITSLNALLRVVLTIGFELLVLVFAFRVKRMKAWRDVAIVNAVTQFVLSFFVIQAYLNGGLFLFIFALFLGEVIVWIGEFLIYLKLLKPDLGKWNIFFYTTIANFITFFLSIFLAQFV